MRSARASDNLWRALLVTCPMLNADAIARALHRCRMCKRLALGRTGRKHLKKRQQIEQEVATEQQTIEEASFAAVKLLLRGY